MSAVTEADMLDVAELEHENRMLRERIAEMQQALEGLVNERQPLGIDRPEYQSALAALDRLGLSKNQPRQPLTREQIKTIYKEHGVGGLTDYHFARAIEAAHGITGEAA